MGFDVSAINFLFHSRKKGVTFGKTLMLGRQSYQLDKSYLEKCFRQNGEDDSKVASLLKEDKEYVEPFLRFLGAETVHSMDASDYEKATLVHDLNQPVPESLHQQYDVVIDAGTFEHIFNFPQVISNAMKMVKPGGHLISITPSNNFFGHGFYQFSPELFFRVLSEENGFNMVDLYLGLAKPFAPWYAVSDPKSVRRRVIMDNARPTYLLINARKVAEVPLFEKTPQQSDYEFLSWQGEAAAGQRVTVQGILKKLPYPLWKLAHTIKYFLTGKMLRTMMKGYGNGRAEFFKKVKR